MLIFLYQRKKNKDMEKFGNQRHLQNINETNVNENNKIV